MSEPVQFRDFDAEFPVKTVPQVSFKLGGERLTTLAHMHPSVFFTEARGVRAAIDILTRTLDAESRTKLTEMVENPDVVISDEQLDEAASWVIRFLSEAVNRPTIQSVPSGNGDGQTGPTSEDVSSSPEPVAT